MGFLTAREQKKKTGKRLPIGKIPKHSSGSKRENFCGVGYFLKILSFSLQATTKITFFPV